MSAPSTIYSLFNATDNLDDPVPPLNHKSVAYGFVITFLSVAHICAYARLYVRFCVTKCPGWDDLFVVLSMVTCTVLAISVLVGINEGLGRHFAYIVSNADQLVSFTKAFYVENACYPTATALIKIAILLQFRRIIFSERSNRRYQVVTKLMIVLTALWGVGFSFISWLPAFPVHALWDRSITNAVRYGIASLDPTSFTSTYVTLTATNMVLDLLILTIPVPYYLKSSLSWKSRASLSGLFLLGSAINFISLYRLINVVETRAGTYPTLDPSFYDCTSIILSSLEVSLAAIAASLPVFWPIIQQNLGNIFVRYEITFVTEEHKETTGRDGQGQGQGESPRPPAHMWVPQDIPMAYLTTEITRADEDKESLVKPVQGTGLRRSASTARIKTIVGNQGAHMTRLLSDAAFHAHGKLRMSAPEVPTSVRQ